MENLPDIDGFTVQHLPIVTAYAQKIGVVEIINTLVLTQMEIDAGTVILGMVLDTLTGRNHFLRVRTSLKRILEKIRIRIKMGNVMAISEKFMAVVVWPAR